jgi:hypothetical protein
MQLHRPVTVRCMLAPALALLVLTYTLQQRAVGTFIQWLCSKERLAGGEPAVVGYGHAMECSAADAAAEH